MTPSEYHPVPIPAEDLEAVYELLATRARTRHVPAGDGASESDVARRSNAKDEVWTDELLERVARGDAISTQVLTDIMDVLVIDPRGQGEYNREQLVEETGHSAGRVSATFTKLSPHFRKHYGTNWWPVLGGASTQQDPPRPGTFYSMTPVIAERWKRIRNL